MEKGRKINRVVVPVFIHGGVQLLSFTPKYCEFSQCFSMRMCIMGAKLKTVCSVLQCVKDMPVDFYPVLILVH